MCLISLSISPCLGRNLCTTLFGSTNLSKEEGTTKLESTGIQYCGSNKSSELLVSVPESWEGTILTAWEMYLPRGTKSELWSLTGEGRAVGGSWEIVGLC